eukprot:TRINITY_DN6498_c0_g1_i9.p1 TRINITY_DN6498_c0_g1~~TRINITY_DN6498_c0_g1_i9.p1  ORF type:complete len:147 (+),score=52.66 TRINITY_DN6498_c0_g1_i9:124-564(+)
MFECLVGYPPFYADDPMTTCRKIVNWRRYLKFPDEANLSDEAMDLIRRLICDAQDRLTFEEIKAHPFFRNIDWDGIRNTESPIVPEVTSEIDTQNFDKFEEVDSVDDDVPPLRPGESNAAQPFIGYTFKRYEEKRTNLNDLFGGRR